MIIDWNTHLFSADQARYPFHPRATYRPGRDRLLADPLTAYLESLAELGVDGAVLVQPEPYGDDHSLVLDSLERSSVPLWATSLFYPDDPRAAQKLATLVTRGRVVSTRFHALRGNNGYFASFDDDGVRSLWRQATELGLVVELHIGPDFARGAAEAVRAFPDTPVLIDHLAEPASGSEEEYDDVLRLAELDNVYMKLSGIAHFADDGPLYESAIPRTRPVIDAFGPDRMVWGAGDPRIVDVHAAHLGEAERRKIKGDNLARLLAAATR